jgi:predicted metal-dependent peptidase
MKNDLSGISKTILFKEPFYGMFLIGLKKEFTDQVPTAAVSKNKIGVGLYINPEYFNSLDKDKKYGLIKHELLHIAFGHLMIRDMYPDHKLFNIAADLEINQYIDRNMLPEGGLTLDTFSDLNLPYRAGTKKYYELLQQANKWMATLSTVTKLGKNLMRLMKQQRSLFKNKLTIKSMR